MRAKPPRQLTLDPGDDRAPAIEAVTDRACTRYGPGTIRPTTLATTKQAGKGTVPEHPKPDALCEPAEKVVSGVVGAGRDHEEMSAEYRARRPAHGHWRGCVSACGAPFRMGARILGVHVRRSISGQA
ncbi:hypothetical protein [Streptomyces sp. NPDC054849]